MRILRQFGVLGLILVSCLAPAMACMVPDTQMNTQERACCQMMRDQCGQVDMPMSHGCCQKTPQSNFDKALIINATNYHPAAIAVAWLKAYEWLQPSPLAIERINRPDYSPPQFPPGSNSILRI